jgi:hypothetical protein
MTPKEKAQELTDKYRMFTEFSSIVAAKQCALIAVDEILEEFDHLAWDNETYGNTKMKYWQEVKQEIEKL